ncbi:MAG: cupin domain-containing protein [Acidobacteria bacterium]|nr:cupin domain-containing protein [Acidobacteriota bacterium]
MRITAAGRGFPPRNHESPFTPPSVLRPPRGRRLVGAAARARAPPGPVSENRIARGSLFACLPPAGEAEAFANLFTAPGLRIERIVSHGHASPDGFWYDQGWEEWVLVLAGSARLEIEGEPEPLPLAPGDWVALPARRRHRVAWTSPDEPTVWLAIHLTPC